MSNLDICYNALSRAFDKENIIMPLVLVKILKPDGIRNSSIILTNTSNIDCESDTTTNNDSVSSDESDDLNQIDLNNTIQENVNSGSKDVVAKTKSITRSFSSLALTTNTHAVNLSLSSLTLTAKANPLDLPQDRKCRQEAFNKLNQLIFNIREQKTKTKEVYELPPLVKQIIRCLYPSDIDDKTYLQKPDVIFTLKTFVELFRI
ncbi:unnamed protein product [Adineta steineri]|uniref:Uncharacterized protein n=1 Tax=Adineta steineri TaxID=433720 RepID=A0A815HAR7_9BILA|nr:unnamed protein product [Adineta steineri]CAF4127594.1 unnamed protein product [Adineta steineri]